MPVRKACVLAFCFLSETSYELALFGWVAEARRKLQWIS